MSLFAHHRSTDDVYSSSPSLCQTRLCLSPLLTFSSTQSVSRNCHESQQEEVLHCVINQKQGKGRGGGECAGTHHLRCSRTKVVADSWRRLGIQETPSRFRREFLVPPLPPALGQTPKKTSCWTRLGRVADPPVVSPSSCLAAGSSTLPNVGSFLDIYAFGSKRVGRRLTAVLLLHILWTAGHVPAQAAIIKKSSSNHHHRRRQNSTSQVGRREKQ